MKRKALLLLSLGLLFLIQARGLCWSQTTVRVSVDSAGVEGDGPSFHPSISADGRYVAFDSDANLVATDSGSYYDIFVHDRDADENGTYDEPGGIATVRASVDSGGIEGNRPSSEPSISSDGRHVAFESDADNLVAGDTPFPFGFPDVFVHDRDADENGTYDEPGGISTVRVSVDSAGDEGDGPSFHPSISGDGRFVAFDSDALLVGPLDTNGKFDIFVHDRDADENGTYDEPGGIATVRVSVDSGGNEANDASVEPSISGNGRFVAFSSFATDLVGVGNDTNGKFDIFVHDRDADENGTYDEPGGISTVRVSVASGGGQADGDSNAPSISADGRYVAFDSDAIDLLGVGNDTNGKFDIFVHDRQTVTTIRVSVASGGGQGNGHSYSPSISENGRYVAFHSEADNLVVNDLNGSADVFVHDRDADGNGTYDEVGGISTVRVSVVSGGAEEIGDSSNPAISSDGTYVAFDSYADLVATDSGDYPDIFVYEREDRDPTVDSTSPANNANGVGVGTAITATFSEPMNGSTIDTNSFTLDNGVTGTVTYDANTTRATFTPTSKLDYETTYTATITTAVMDLDDNSIAPDYTWTFTTKSEKNNSGGSGPCFITTAASDWADF